jgi:hypothetical protein
VRTVLHHLTGLGLALALAGLSGAAIAQAPDAIEDFDTFPGIPAGSPVGTIVANDAGTMFELLTASVSTGWLVAPGPGQPAPDQGIGVAPRTETAFLINSADFSGATFTSQSHMIAFRIFYTGTGATLNQRMTALAVYEAGAGFPAYAIRCGRDNTVAPGVLGISATVCVGGGPPPTAPSYASFSNIALAENTWHTVVVMYNNATTSAALDAQIRIWVNPVTGLEPPNLQNVAGTIGTQSGPAGFANYGMRPNFFGVPATGPTNVTVDTIGIWNGNGTPGDNDLAAAVAFLTTAVPVELSAFGLE